MRDGNQEVALGVPGKKLDSWRRLALVAVAAVVTLAVGYEGGQLATGGHRPVAAPSPPVASTPAAAPAATGSSAAGPAASSASQPAAGGSPPPAQAGAASPTSTGHLLPTQLPSTTFRDTRNGLQISYPQAWTRLASADPTVSLLVRSADGVSLLVRAAQLRQPINGPRLAALRDYEGLTLKAMKGVSIIAGPRLLGISNLPGYLYIYDFNDPATHRRSAHSEIVLFSGRRMYTLIFQTSGANDLPRFAQLFDKITESFRAI